MFADAEPCSNARDSHGTHSPLDEAYLPLHLIDLLPIRLVILDMGGHGLLDILAPILDGPQAMQEYF